MNASYNDKISISTRLFSSTHFLRLIINGPIFFTVQGTTGSPKAALLSHHNLINSAMQIGTRFELDVKVLWLTSLPMMKIECGYLLT
jgi:acyl-CoA synthetase (AMP-forming)/AMP-acid ligase II